METQPLDPTKQPAKIVFINRADTYFGRILAQHFAHASLIIRPQETLEPTRELFDLAFLDEEPASGGSFKVFGTFRPEHSLNPYEPAKRPPKVPGAVGLCPADNYAHIGKIIFASDICVFHTVDHDGLNEVLEDTARAVDVMTKTMTSTAERSSKVVVLVSTAMTWARTKEDPFNFISNDDRVGKSREAENTGVCSPVERMGFCEEEFRRRKPHPNFRCHLELERKVMKLGTDSHGLITVIVIAAGLIYGYGENLLHWMFKEAWLTSSAVPVPGPGHVHIPTIHARDLCQIVQAVSITPPRNPYIIAVDDGRASLLQIATAISQHLSTGAVEHISADEALMKKVITAYQYDLFNTDLFLEHTTVRDGLKVKWLAQPGILAAFPRLIEEFKTRRNLYPLKLAVHGPPYSGKTRIAQALCRDYKLHYVDVKAVVQAGLTELENLVKHGVKEEDGTVDGGPGQMWEAIQASKEKNGGVVGDLFVIRFLREFLHGLPCQNQGFVLDGYPEAYATAKELFTVKAHPGTGGKEDEGKMQQEGAVQAMLDRALLPDCIICLEAPDDFLKQRVLSQLHNPFPKKEPPIEHTIVQRFAEYNFLSNDEDNTLTYFEQANIPIHYIDITQDKCQKMDKTLHTAMRLIGRPHKYPLTKEEKLDLLREEAERRIRQADEDAKQAAFREQLSERDRARRCEQWRAEFERLALEEKKPKKHPVVPMKQYLMTHIFPVLIDGLAACVAARPADPVDFLAEYLLRNSRPLYLDEKVSFTKMTAPFMRKRKAEQDAKTQQRKKEEEKAVQLLTPADTPEEPETTSTTATPPVTS